jgi:hypothetical protein
MGLTFTTVRIRPCQQTFSMDIRVHSMGKTKSGECGAGEERQRAKGTTERYLLLYMHRLSAHRKLMTRFFYCICSAPVLHRAFASDDHLQPPYHTSHVKRPNTSTEPLLRAVQTLQEGLRWLCIEPPLLFYSHSRSPPASMLLLHQDVKVLQSQHILGRSVADESPAHSEDAFCVIC